MNKHWEWTIAQEHKHSGQELKAKKMLAKLYWHSSGCQCHRHIWARGVIARRIFQSFENWRKR